MENEQDLNGVPPTMRMGAPTTAEDRRRWLAETKEARAADALQIKLFAKALVRDDPKRISSGSGDGPSLNS